MTPALALLAILAIVMVGAAVIWANPSRIVNRAFFSFSLHASFWLLCVHIAVVTGERHEWVRLASALGASITPHMWLLKQAILTRERFWSELPERKYFWFGAAVAQVGLCYTDWYVRPGFEDGHPHFGPAYFINTATILILYGLLWQETRRQIRLHTGLERLELQILLLGGTATAFGVLVLMALRAILHATWPIQLQPFVVLTLWIAIAVAITTHRVFDARQIVRVGVQKFILVAGAAFVAFLVDQLLVVFELPQPLVIFAAVAIALWIAAMLNGLLDRVFEFYPQGNEARHAAFAAARREGRAENLEVAFREVLKGWGQTEHAIVLSGANDSLTGSGIELREESVLINTMRQLRWATPERLEREKSTIERTAIGDFLKRHSVSALVLSDGATMSALVGVGYPASRRPFTYPQIAQLMELGSIVQSALERAHFSTKAQHAEQLATVGLLGASLAHEIRNPLVSIKTFVQLLPSHHHDAAFREKFFRLISDEVSRIDQLTEQLLDLASPRAYTPQMIDLHPVLAASLELAAAKAAHKRIQFLTDFQANPDRAFTDSSAAKQVMLNLCFNAIQAVEDQNGEVAERWVRVATRNVDTGIEMAVADSGPGIAPEIRPKLFQPFQTTKSTGFGLGLAICSDILANLHATISIDPPAPGCGATFRVVFPCQPSSS